MMVAEDPYFGPCTYSFSDEGLTLNKVMGHACCGAYLPERLLVREIMSTFMFSV